jgi:hypothetical protein
MAEPAGPASADSQGEGKERRLTLRKWSPREGLDPSTFRLRVETHLSSRYRPGRFRLLRSVGSSSQCVLDLPCYGRGNDQADSGEIQQSMMAFRSGSEVGAGQPVTQGLGVLSIRHGSSGSNRAAAQRYALLLHWSGASGSSATIRTQAL